MNKAEARQLLEARVERLRELSYEELIKINRQKETVTGKSGADYYLEVQSFFEDSSATNLRVTVNVDDGGWYAWKSMTDHFMKTLDGSFVGE